MSLIENLSKSAQNEIIGYRDTAAALWILACKHDRIAPESRFVVFSKKNKYAQFYNIALHRLFESWTQYQAGGYVGLVIQSGKGDIPKHRRKK